MIYSWDFFFQDMLIAYEHKKHSLGDIAFLYPSYKRQ